jgi:tetratricopeptide (TPR) repeat protein
LWEEVLAADTTGLTARERLIVERSRAVHDKRFDDASAMVDQYLVKYPNDPYVIHQKALNLWNSGDFDQAERLNRRLVEIAPNWVIAYNQLGYIAMSQGRFAEAEEYFTSYRFVAPDQANPHDSLGELYIILGRYDEAEASLLRSLEIKPDFWNAYDHLALARVLMGDFQGAEEAGAMAQATGACPDYWSTGMTCFVSYFELAASERWREIVATVGDQLSCLEGQAWGYSMVTVHRAACLLGEKEIAQSIEDKVDEMLTKAEDSDGMKELPEILGLKAHLRGVRLAVGGDLEGAITSFSDADDHMTYMQAGSGLFKLFNRLMLVETLAAAGEDGEARELLSQVRSVNPRMAQDFEDSGLEILGLRR